MGKLPVKAPAPMAGYDQDLFHSGWPDTDGNGCDARNDTLRRDLDGEQTAPGSDGCSVLEGTLADRYTGRQIRFVEGQAEVEIDHVVALSAAWRTGAQQLSSARREQLANDPLELVAADEPAVTAKNGGDAAAWLPPNRSYRCHYVARQIAVKAKYGLWVTAAEHSAMSRVLATCATFAAPVSAPWPAPTTRTDRVGPTEPQSPVSPATAPPTTEPPTTEPPVTAPEGPVYANCDAVRAAGKAPLLRGQPGYAPHLDADNDGVACEDTTVAVPAPPPPADPPPAAVYYANCDAVRAAGKAPILRGQPGYDSHLDRDGDGVACEP